MFEKEGTAVKLPDTLLKFIEEWKDKPGNLIMILHQIQEEYGYIPREVAIELSRLILYCMGKACYLKGGEDIILEFERLLGLPVNGITEDGLFSLQAVRCIGCCGLAPVITVNKEVFGKLTKEMLPGIIAKFKGN